MEQLILAAFVLGIALLIFRRRQRKQLKRKQAEAIDRYQFPPRLKGQLQKTYPHLTQKDCEQVILGLREYFHLCRLAGPKKMVAMPSQAVDVVWHEFILFTRDYHSFCKQALGRFLHHTPAEAMRGDNVQDKRNQSVRLAWQLSCSREGINPKSPDRLPVLFAMDAALNIEDGFKYSRDCSQPGSHKHCASTMGCGGHGCGSDPDGGSDGCGGGCGGD